jgi:hypothetical protein
MVDSIHIKVQRKDEASETEENFLKVIATVEKKEQFEALHNMQIGSLGLAPLVTSGDLFVKDVLTRLKIIFFLKQTVYRLCINVIKFGFKDVTSETQSKLVFI